MQNTLARILATIAALACALAGAVVDLGTHTHVWNPEWPPHARYHDVMFVVVCLGVGAVCLWLVWSPTSSTPRDRFRTLQTITLLLGLIFAAFFIALLAPGASAETPGMPRPLGIPVNLLSAVVGLATVPVMYGLEARAIRVAASARGRT